MTPDSLPPPFPPVAWAAVPPCPVPSVPEPGAAPAAPPEAGAEPEATTAPAAGEERPSPLAPSPSPAPTVPAPAVPARRVRVRQPRPEEVRAVCPECGTLAPLVAPETDRVIGLLVWTRVRRSTTPLCRRCAGRRGLRDSFVTLCAGWWAFPLGPAWTLWAVARNTRRVDALNGRGVWVALAALLLMSAAVAFVTEASRAGWWERFVLSPEQRAAFDHYDAVFRRLRDDPARFDGNDPSARGLAGLFANMVEGDPRYGDTRFFVEHLRDGEGRLRDVVLLVDMPPTVGESEQDLAHRAASYLDFCVGARDDAPEPWRPEYAAAGMRVVVRGGASRAAFGERHPGGSIRRFVAGELTMYDLIRVGLCRDPGKRMDPFDLAFWE
ncbi:MAG: hypothetical protein HY719_13580 [Planctomycetes bacterium]|nr:hypothetical protein [Planctomycetota bacterium]